ncbi:NAD(P)H-dependent oxidoreductase [Anaerovorax odorimutans]|uniref:NAD(P)H-dependent oxidoreductase n=1 Tax=Anaerovorax odorimutans TaxID=109327 RepID=UPI0003F8C82B|nr:NAD(P)H-dependent oxidoreductase [Anaerovorax odorimutans]
MKLLVINGSPKLGENNTEILLESFIEGFNLNKNNDVERVRMNTEETYKKAAEYFQGADNILIGFPLYSYSMPAGVKLFIEELEPLIGKCQDKKIGFLVQYGFVEAVHARPLEGYLKYITEKLSAKYIGTIIRGGCDGLTKNADKPRNKNEIKFLEGAKEIGKYFGENGHFDKEQLKKYSEPETEKKHNIFILKILVKLLNKIYWQKQLKKNGISLKESFAKPLSDEN